MQIWEIIVLAVSLSMDAFAVSVSKGLTLKKMRWSRALIAGAYFGVFQALMPLIGFFIGSTFAHYVEQYAHWIAFAILFLIGLNMIREAFGKDEEVDGNFSFRSMLILAVATSIDALTVGISFSMQPPVLSIYATVCIIGCVTFVISGFGVFVGNLFGSRYKKPAEIAGGVILVLIAVKVLLSGLGILSF